MNVFTIIACISIVSCFLWALAYINSTNDDNFVVRKQWIDQLPSIISTLGVLGTFVGITVGLIAFDPNNLDRSIPDLLEGLKTAFFTSLCGMTGSVILNRVVSKKFGEKEKQSAIDKAAEKIVQAINNSNESTRNEVKSSMEKLPKDFVENESIKTIISDVKQLKEDVNKMNSEKNEMNSKLENISNRLERMQAIIMTATTSVSTIDNTVDEIKNELKKD